jgi:nicotinamidase-related amidase
LGRLGSVVLVGTATGAGVKWTAEQAVSSRIRMRTVICFMEISFDERIFEELHFLAVEPV